MLETNCRFLHGEIMDVIRAFGSDADFSHYFSASGGEFYNCIEVGGEFYDFKEKYEAEDELEFKRLAKRSAKLAMYSVLKGMTGRALPWGALTGIRPTKLAYSEIARGRDFKPLFCRMDVSEANIALTEEVIAAQRGIYGADCGKALFISVPFCPTKCEYCSFITAPIDRTAGYIDEYVDRLIEEIASVGQIGGISSVYIGGGTPFVLDNSKLSRIYAAVRENFGSVREFTVEAGRPDVFTAEKLRTAREAGVTRICVNPQTFNDATLAAIGRRHTAEQCLKAYALAREFGFDINVDLIAGLADESADDFASSLEKALELAPENITVHTLSLKSGARLKEEKSVLKVEGIDRMIALSREMLRAAGYVPYYLYRQKYQAGCNENVGWCRQGKQCVYNIAVMEEIADNIAVGSNAISKRIYGGENRIERYASPKDIPTYIAKLGEIISRRNSLFSD